MTELDPRMGCEYVHGITIHVFTEADDSARARFLRLFAEAWRTLPSDVRRRLRRHWRSCVVDLREPWVELTDGWARREPGTLGRAEFRGTRVLFHAPSIVHASDMDVRFVVAHELAHVLQWAENRPRSRTGRERDADRRAKAWLKLSRRPHRTRALRDFIRAEFVEAFRAGWEPGA